VRWRARAPNTFPKGPPRSGGVLAESEVGFADNEPEPEADSGQVSGDALGVLFTATYN